MQQRLTVEEIAAKLKPVFGKKIDEVYLRYSMADSREEKEEIESLLNALYHKYLSELLTKKVLLEPPSEEEMQGGYPLCKVSYAGKQLYDFNLREKDWPRHVCITGMSGSGKTTLATRHHRRVSEQSMKNLDAREERNIESNLLNARYL